MENDLLNSIDDTEYIAYDRIYDEKTKIVGKNIMRETSTNNTNTCITTINDLGECVCGFYRHSRKFILLLFCVISVLIGILYLIVYIMKH